jgi:hypothetical protein
MRSPGLLAAVLVAAACGTSTSSTSSHQGSGSGGGGDDGGIPTFTGLVPCGQAYDAGTLAEAECALSMPVQGGISGSIQVPNLLIICGSGSDPQGISSLDWGTNTGNNSSVSVSATFESAVPFDQTGTFPAHVEIGQGSGDGGQAQWQTPTGGCSFTIAGSICLTASVSTLDGGSVTQTRRILSGTGTCAQPAAPQAGNGAAPITIGSFSFLSTVGP